MDNKEQQSNGITLSDIWNAVKKNWIVMAIIVVALTLIGTIYVKVGKTPTYSASSSIIVQVPSNASSTSTSTDSISITDSIRYVYTVSDLINNKSISNSVAEKYNETHEDGITSSFVKANTKTSFTTNSLYLTIRFIDTDRERAVEINNLITDAIVAMQNDGDETTTDDLLCYITATYKPQTIADTAYVGPNVLLYVIISFLGGCVVACVYAFIKEFMSTKFKTKDEIGSIGYPIVGLQYDNKEKGKNPGKDLVDASIQSLDPYNKVLNGIKYSDFNKDIKSVMVTSTGADELKSTVVANLAFCAANNKKKVVLVDLDVRKPRQHQIFNLNRKEGIVEYLDGEISKEELIKKTDRGVDVITVGKNITNPMVILESEKLKELINELKAEYDYVFVDTPPLLVCSDALVISKMVDGVIYNVAINQAKKKETREALKTLEDVEANVVGINITKYKAISKKDYYYYSYKYYNTNTEANEETKENN